MWGFRYIKMYTRWPYWLLALCLERLTCYTHNCFGLADILYCLLHVSLEKKIIESFSVIPFCKHVDTSCTSSLVSKTILWLRWPLQDFQTAFLTTVVSICDKFVSAIVSFPVLKIRDHVFFLLSAIYMATGRGYSVQNYLSSEQIIAICCTVFSV